MEIRDATQHDLPAPMDLAKEFMDHHPRNVLPDAASAAVGHDHVGALPKGFCQRQVKHRRCPRKPRDPTARRMPYEFRPASRTVRCLSVRSSADAVFRVRRPWTSVPRCGKWCRSLAHLQCCWRPDQQPTSQAPLLQPRRHWCARRCPATWCPGGVGRLRSGKQWWWDPAIRDGPAWRGSLAAGSVCALWVSAARCGLAVA